MSIKVLYLSNLKKFLATLSCAISRDEDIVMITAAKYVNTFVG